jgi:hypothetical protein
LSWKLDRTGGPTASAGLSLVFTVGSGTLSQFLNDKHALTHSQSAPHAISEATLRESGTENHSKKMHTIGKVSAMENRKKARFNELQSAA